MPDGLTKTDTNYFKPRKREPKFLTLSNSQMLPHRFGGWLGRAMVLGSFQCRGRPTTLAYGRARACCPCSRCWTGGLFFYIFFISSILSSFSNASSVGRLLDILKYCGLGRYSPSGSCQLLPEACLLSTG